MVEGSVVHVYICEGSYSSTCRYIELSGKLVHFQFFCV